MNRLGLWFEHDGIVVDVKSGDPTPDDVHVIHFAWSAKKRVIIETTLKAFMAMGKNSRVVNDESTLKPSIIVERARSQLDRADYHLLGRNCQHFARWCVKGSAFSSQVFNFCAFGAAFGLVVVLASAMGMAAAAGAMW
jgi:hypothetical protein